MADDWLDGAKVKAVIGADVAADVDTPALELFAGAARSYVEDRRPDLWAMDPADDPLDPVLPPVFTPPAHVVVAAAMLAYRCYLSRTTAADELGRAPDLAAMLGVGKSRKFGFGGAAVPLEVVL